jgi:hypothetical protein
VGPHDLAGFIGLSAVEIPISHLMPPWPSVRVVLLVVGGYGLFWMIGLLATIYTPPHLIRPSGRRIRTARRWT